MIHASCSVLAQPKKWDFLEIQQPKPSGKIGHVSDVPILLSNFIMQKEGRAAMVVI